MQSLTNQGVNTPKSKKPATKPERGLYDDEFQKRLIKILIEERDKFKNDMQYINQNAFTNTSYKLISGTIKDYVFEYDYVPSYDLLNSLLSSKISDDIDLELTLESLKEIRELDSEGLVWVRKEAIDFFKRQELVKFFNMQLEDLKNGIDITSRDLQGDIGKIQSIGTHDTIFSGVYDDLEETFEPQSIVRIPTTCKEIDEYLQGGIIKPNLVVVAAGSGVGKTTISSALAHGAAISDFKVLQVFFEDKVPAIKRKIFGAITEIEARLINTEEYSERAKQLALNYEHKDLVKKNIKLAKFRNGEVTPNMLKQYVLGLINSGFKPDMIIIDYFECMANPIDRTIQNEWKLETKKMREIENLCTDFDCAIVVTTQGTKDSMEGMLLTMNKIGGSAGKVQVGHMVITLNRTQKDADENRAELFIPKNREGKAGRIFSLHLNNGIPKLVVDSTFESIEVLKAKQKQDAHDMPPPEVEYTKRAIDRINKKYDKTNEYD